MRRACRLLEDGFDPRRIMAVTFTRTSAGDLKRALGELGVEGAEAIRATTLHGYCYALLKRDDVFEWTQRHPRPLLDFERRFLIEDLTGEGFGGVRAKKKEAGSVLRGLGQVAIRSGQGMLSIRHFIKPCSPGCAFIEQCLLGSL
jgi:hypothetical protein